MDTFFTIDAPSEGLYKEKGSKFIARAYYVESEQHVKERVEELRKEYFDARHHCFAFILGRDRQHTRANDDGEPNGTAGLPILGQIKSKGLTNVLIVVVRYFGGTKLGASGLVTAYKTAAADALANAVIVEKIVYDLVNVTFDYLAMNEVMKIIKDYELEITDQHFDNECTIGLRVRQKLTEQVRGKFEKIDKLNLQITMAAE